jgi:hypothetical protein
MPAHRHYSRAPPTTGIYALFVPSDYSNGGCRRAEIHTGWRAIMEFEVYLGVFCVLVGISWGIVYFAFQILKGGPNMLVSCGERNEEGNVKFFNLWNLGLVSTLTVASILWLSLKEDTFVARIIADSYVYLFQPGIAG